MHGSITCLNLSRLRRVLKMRMNTGPVVRALKSKYCALQRFRHLAPPARLSLQYVPRQPTLVFTVKNGTRVNGIRSVGVDLESREPGVR